MDISGEQREARKIDVLDKAGKHRKECQKCTKEALCDIAVQINLETMIAFI